ncbi:Small subunit (SSU) processome component [Toensbergia leucococca]|nr:Small subunit (SSU) processome component [Toensbergia leucococca]
MVRKLKHHEQKLLRKVDFTTYKSDSSHRASSILRRYSIQNPADYAKYNRICGALKQLAHRLSLLPPSSPFRRKHEDLLLDKLHALGILGLDSKRGKLSEVERKVSVSRFARRRLGVVMGRVGMLGGGAGVSGANKLVEQGHVRVGTEVVTDPAFLVGRGVEDFVGWVDGSKVRRSVLRYREKVDDFDLL